MVSVYYHDARTAWSWATYWFVPGVAASLAGGRQAILGDRADRRHEGKVNSQKFHPSFCCGADRTFAVLGVWAHLVSRELSPMYYTWRLERLEDPALREAPQTPLEDT